MKLPYAKDALTPFMSEDTVEFHYEKHHKAYVDKLNALVEGTDLSKLTLVELIRRSYSSGKIKQNDIFNNAAQVWNHDFFWKSMSPTVNSRTMSSVLQRKIDDSFGSFEEMRDMFVQESRKQFGSGWVWLVSDKQGNLWIRTTHDAVNLLSDNEWFPLLVCDVWEHAYYLDYQNRRPAFAASFIVDLANWEFAERNLDAVLNII